MTYLGKYISIHPLRQNIYDILFYSKCVFMEICLVSILLIGNVIKKKVNLNLYHSFFVFFTLFDPFTKPVKYKSLGRKNMQKYKDHM